MKATAAMSNDAISPRMCVICEEVLVRRGNEEPFYFARRLTCSSACGAVLRSISRKGTNLRDRRAAAQSVACIPVGRHYFSVIDAEDFERVILHPWHALHKPHGVVYAIAHIGSRQVFLHRFVLGDNAPPLVDHKNRFGLDCRKSNLRPASDAQNAFNRKRQSNNTSGFKGVSYFRQSGKWKAAIGIGRRVKSLGLYSTPEEAARAYDEAARNFFGSFARLNFPEEGEQHV